MQIVKLDFDKPTQFILLRAYFTLKYLGAKVFTFRTNKGWHIYALFDKEGKSPLDLRRYLGDDEGRIEFDEVREQLGLYDWMDTLFTEKYVVSKQGIKKVHEEMPANPLYEPWVLRKFR